MVVKHIIWDFNGTILDDADFCHDLMLETCKEYGLENIEKDFLRDCYTHPIEVYYRRVGFDFKDVSFSNIASSFMGRYREGISGCSIRPQIKPLLQSLSDQGISHSVLSAIKEDVLHELLQSHGLSNYFIAARGLSDCHGASKIEAGRSHIKSLNLLPEETILIGDTLHDLETARDLGIEPLLIYSGYQSLSTLTASSAPVLDCLSNIPAYLAAAQVRLTGQH